MTTIKSIILGFVIRVSLLFITWLFFLYLAQNQVLIGGFSSSIILGAILLGLTVNTGFFTWFNVIKPYDNALKIAENIKKGTLKKENEIDSDLSDTLLSINENFNEAAQFSLAIGEGNFEKKLELLNEKDGLGFALNEMSLKLQNVAEEDRKRNWVVNGEAKFGELLRINQDQSLEELSFLYIKDLIKYLAANQGGVYLINKEEYNNHFIELIAFYAYEKRKFQKRKLALDEGLLGQCIIEKDYVYLDDIPEDYIKITSGLGTSNPRSILVVPLMVNDIVLGAIEIASFNTFSNFEIVFVQQLAKGFAATISNMQINAVTQNLLEESRKATEDLKIKEDDLKANSGELIKIQEALNEKLVEIERESAYTESIVSAINSTNASLVLDMTGKILEVNEMFLSIMEYSREELIGREEITLVAEDEITSERYQMMFDSVKGGAFNSGEFRRINKSGRELWITGSYSPIFDINGVAYKIILFAQFTTEQKERELELKSKIEAINNSIPTIELNLDLGVITANPIFLTNFGFKRMDLRNKKLNFVLDPDFAESDEIDAIWETVLDDNVISHPLKMITKNGETKHYFANFSPAKNLVGNIYKILVILIDLTEQELLKDQLNLLLKDEKRKNSLLELKIETNQLSFEDEISDLFNSLDQINTQESLAKIIKTKKIPIIELDELQNITYINKYMQDIIGYNNDNIKNETIFDYLFMDVDEVQKTISKIKSNELCQFKLRFKTIDSVIVYLNVYVIPAKIDQSNFKYLMIGLNEEPESAA